MKKEIHSTSLLLAEGFMNLLMKNYLIPLRFLINKYPELRDHITGFLINPEKVEIYIGRTHIAIEYLGSEVIDKSSKDIEGINCQCHDFSKEECNLLEKIIGLNYDSDSFIKLPLSGVVENLIATTHKGGNKLEELNWNYAAQDALFSFGPSVPWAVENQFVRIINGFFFDANDSGLKTRHIKWLDLFPVKFNGNDPVTDSFLLDLSPAIELIEHDLYYKYPIPSDYKYEKLPRINRFIELWGNKEKSETQITKFLSLDTNNFILTMRFGAIKSHAELLCKWQNGEKVANIKPDFFIVHSNGFADIVEFKLPNIKGNPVVGSENRESFSSWLNSYVSQTRVYRKYFDDVNNRKWFENNYGFKVFKPKRWLVVGRRYDFDEYVWKEIVSDYNNVEIITFDDLIDGVVAQFYK